jgi:hypothetical protein
MSGNGMGDPSEVAVILVSQTAALRQPLGAQETARYKAKALSDWNIT